jgi:hypothetical protein
MTGEDQESKKAKAYFYQPPPSSTIKEIGNKTTFVLDKEALNLPIQAQNSLQETGYFVSVTGGLFTHRDPRIAPAPVWVRLLPPTWYFVYIAQFLYLLSRFRLSLFPSILILFMALDHMLQKLTNLDGEHCANLCTLASLLLLCCLASDHLSFLASGINQYSNPPLVLSSSDSTMNYKQTSSFSSWFSYLFPVADWSKLIVWPIGASMGLVTLHSVFTRCKSFVWMVSWTFVGIIICIYCLVTMGDQVEVYGTIALASLLCIWI